MHRLMADGTCGHRRDERQCNEASHLEIMKGEIDNLRFQENGRDNGQPNQDCPRCCCELVMRGGVGRAAEGRKERGELRTAVGVALKATPRQVVPPSSPALARPVLT